jgi:zinc transporter, ZIP family
VTLDGIPENMALGVSLLETSGAGALTLLVATVVVGNFALSGMGMEEGPLAMLLSFAGGAVLASLADTLMPDAYREGGKWVAFATAAGFLLSFLIAEV